MKSVEALDLAGKLEKQLKKKRKFESVQMAAIIGLARTSDLFLYRFGQLLRDYGITEPQYNVLRILRGEANPLPCLEIASRLIRKVPAITHLIDKLEQRGLVSRKRCTKDRRVWYVSLTTAGGKLLADLDGPVKQMHQDLCCGLTTSECKQLEELLEKARAAIEDQ